MSSPLKNGEPPVSRIPPSRKVSDEQSASATQTGNKGRIWPAESVVHRDRLTGVAVRQVTTHPSVHHHPFVYIPSFDDAMQWIVFVSHRTGRPQIFVEERARGRLIQLTDRDDLNEWSIHPSHDGRFVYFTAGCGAWRINITTFHEECLVHFGDVPMIPPGMVADAMGTTTLSADDQWWAVPVKIDTKARLHIINTSTGDCQPIVEANVIGHPEFHPRDSSLLHYAGAYHNRMWVVRRDGSEHRLVYERDVAKKEWIVHEIWNPLRPELLTVNWPHGIVGVDIETGNLRRVSSFPGWHLSIDRAGEHLICDTTWPDKGLHWIDPQGNDDPPKLICESASSNEGKHWETDHCPYDDGPVKVYAPQHTHPHPNISPDGRFLVFTSDCSGHAQLYEVALADN